MKVVFTPKYSLKVSPIIPSLEYLLIFVYKIRFIFASTVKHTMKGITGYISIREASYKWGAPERSVHFPCGRQQCPVAHNDGWAFCPARSLRELCALRRSVHPESGEAS